MAEHNDFGEMGEKMAREHLLKNGYRIRHTNWRYMKDELDIVAEKDGELVIVEVKTRGSEAFGDPCDAITTSKIRHIVNAAQAYIEQFELMMETRFDVIAIVPEGGKYHLTHIENAFIPPIN